MFIIPFSRKSTTSFSLYLFFRQNSKQKTSFSLYYFFRQSRQQVSLFVLFRQTSKQKTNSTTSFCLYLFQTKFKAENKFLSFYYFFQTKQTTSFSLCPFQTKLKADNKLKAKLGREADILGRSKFKVCLYLFHIDSVFGQSKGKLKDKSRLEIRKLRSVRYREITKEPNQSSNPDKSTCIHKRMCQHVEAGEENVPSPSLSNKLKASLNSEI